IGDIQQPSLCVVRVLCARSPHHTAQVCGVPPTYQQNMINDTITAMPVATKPLRARGRSRPVLLTPYRIQCQSRIEQLGSPLPGDTLLCVGR
ncbi:MAG TPA: hypothetical protein VK968_05640, partial [Roseimicrobium sp.]|nr:hypothetical protein [Roseimicrobium sp.]